MKKTLIIILTFIILSAQIVQINAINITDNVTTNIASAGKKILWENLSTSNNLIYPNWKDFTKLKQLIDNSFTVTSNYSYGSNCIFWGKLCTNYHYTSITEKAIGLIVWKTFEDNVDFYEKLLSNRSYRFSSWDKLTLKTALKNIPRGPSISNIKANIFWKNIAGNLLSSSFGIDYSQNTNSILYAINRKIITLKDAKCSKSWWKMCYGEDLSNYYLPTKEELYKESIYNNRKQVKISDLDDEFEYNIIIDDSSKILNSRIQNTPKFIKHDMVDKAHEDLRLIYTGAIMVQWYMLDTEQWYAVDRKMNTKFIKDSKQNYTTMAGYFYWDHVLSTIRSPDLDLATINIIKNNDSKVWIFKWQWLVSSNDMEIYNTFRNLLKSEIEYYYNTILSKNELLVRENKDTYSLSYKKPSYTYKEALIELKKIENNNEVTEVLKYFKKKDYKSMMSSWSLIIPEIFKTVPDDSAFLYVKNPENILSLLEEKSSTLWKITGFDISSEISNMIKTFFELDDISILEKNLKNEAIFILNDLDITNPDVVIVIHDSDKWALSKTLNKHFSASKNGFTYLGNSKSSLDKIMNTELGNSMKNADDLAYVWQKKAPIVNDAFFFVWDKFFEKMLDFDIYLKHLRKFRTYSQLWNIQELSWAYKDAFWRDIKNITELINSLPSNESKNLNKDSLKSFSIKNWIINNDSIGSIKNISWIAEAYPEITNVSREELEDYKINVLKYRDIWRASLDPMGIVINKYWDWVEIDFFMTPLPKFQNQDILEIYNSFGWFAKDKLSFLENPKIRMGLFSSVFGFDAKKIQEKIESNKEINRNVNYFNKEVLDDKSIFDYLAWEFAFSLWSIDSTILESWNIEKIDIFWSVQMTSEEKGKELLEIIRTKLKNEILSSSKNGNYNWLRNEEAMIMNFLVKPIIEKYNWKNIYYVDAIPFPFIGKIGYAYTFLDDFLIIAPNRTTIKKNIDVYKNWDLWKKSIITKDTNNINTFLSFLFDGNNMSSQLKKLFENDRNLLLGTSRLINSNWMSSWFYSWEFQEIIGKFINKTELAKRLWEEDYILKYDFWLINIEWKDWDIKVKIDESRKDIFYDTTRQSWDNLKSDLDENYFSENWVPFDKFLSDPYIFDILSINSIAHLEKIFKSPSSLFKNMTFSVSFWDDEIWFKFRIFRNMPKDDSKWGFFGLNNKTLIIYLTLGITLILIFTWIAFVIKRKKGKEIADKNDTSIIS